MDLSYEELVTLRNVLEDELEVAAALREHVLEEDEIVNALEIVDREAVLRGIHHKVQEAVKGGG